MRFGIGYGFVPPGKFRALSFPLLFLPFSKIHPIQVKYEPGSWMLQRCHETRTHQHDTGLKRNERFFPALDSSHRIRGLLRGLLLEPIKAKDKQRKPQRELYKVVAACHDHPQGCLQLPTRLGSMIGSVYDCGCRTKGKDCYVDGLLARDNHKIHSISQLPPS